MLGMRPKHALGSLVVLVLLAVVWLWSKTSGIIAAPVVFHNGSGGFRYC